MIAERAKQAFLNRQLKNYDFVKNLSEEELDDKLSTLPAKPVFYTNPYTHQKACFYIGANKGNFLFLLEAGSGKSLIALALIDYHKRAGHTKKTLILAPRLANLYTWQEQIETHAPNLTYTILDSMEGIPSKVESRTQLLDNTDTDLYVLNYPGLVYLTTSHGKNPKTGKGEQQLDAKKLAWLSSKFDSIILDECHALRNNRSLVYQSIKSISSGYKIKYGLTGTPMNRNPQDFWTQFYLIDGGRTLGSTLGIYRECFFTTKINRWGGYEYAFKKKMEKKLHDTLKNRSIFYSSAECQTLPQQVFIKRYVNFPEEIKTYYQKLLDDMKSSHGDYKAMDNVFMQMRMMSSGFVGFKNENNEKLRVEFNENPKLDELLGILDEIPKTAKVIVFNEFIYSGDIICKALTKNKIRHVRLYGATKDVQGVLDTFKNDPQCQVMVSNIKSGGVGLNLQHAQYAIYFEIPVSTIDREQSLKRIHRAGSTFDRTFYYDLVMRGTMDEKLLLYLQNGQDLFKSLVAGDITL